MRYKLEQIPNIVNSNDEPVVLCKIVDTEDKNRVFSIMGRQAAINCANRLNGMVYNKGTWE